MELTVLAVSFTVLLLIKVELLAELVWHASSTTGAAWMRRCRHAP
jgi:hypothetical protein